ncbi:MAG: NAD(P)/FAD-dependent oxidoreductase [Polyangiaceae bacterium]
MNNPIDADVIIIGAGFAGLAAALRIKDTNQGLPAEKQLTYVVLEADAQRLGGRAWTRDGVDMDFGGGYIGATQTQIQYLVRRYQVQTIETFLPQDRNFKWLYQNGKNEFTRFPGDNPLAFPGGLNALSLLLKLDGFAIEVRDHLADPTLSALAYLDTKTVADWINEQRAEWDAHPVPVDPSDPNIGVGISADTAEVFVTSVRSAFSLEPSEVSMFFLLYYAATAGGYSSLVDVSGGTGAAEATRFALGTQSLVEAIRQDIDPNNKTVLRGARATKIAYDASGVVVTCDVTGADGNVTQRSLRGRRAIVAMAPPVSINRLSYDPPLEKGDGASVMRYELCQAMGKALGRTIKGFVRFERPFWRERGLMGFLLSAGLPITENPLDWTLDNVWVDPSGNEPDRYSLMTFIVGASASHWSEKHTKAERARAVIAHLKRVYRFENSELLNPSDPESNYVEEDWPQQCVNGLGAPDAMMPPGALTQFGSALRTPIGPIHWAGAESSTEWCGYMNGAIESGFRAASEAVRAVLSGAAGASGAGEGPDDQPPRGTTPPAGVAPKKAA